MDTNDICLVQTHAEIGEGIIWDAKRERLYWVDISKFLIHETDPASGETQSWNIGQYAGFAALRNSGDFIVAAGDGVYTFDPETETLTLFADPEPGKPDHRFNDGCIDPQGRLWAGTMATKLPSTEPLGALYRIDPDGSHTKFSDGFFTTNGLAFSPDGRTMYVSDSGRSVMTVWAYDYDTNTGTPSNLRVFADLRAQGWAPDGACVDDEGCYWSAIVNDAKVVRFRPDGTVDRIIETPMERPAKAVIVDGTLYVTSISPNPSPGFDDSLAGAVCRFEVGVNAPPHPRFAG